MQELLFLHHCHNSMLSIYYSAIESTGAITVSATALSAAIVSTIVESANLSLQVEPQLQDAKVQATIMANIILNNVVFIINSPNCFCLTFNFNCYI